MLHIVHLTYAVIHGSLFLLFNEIILKPLFQNIKFFLYLMLIAINCSFAIKRLLVLAVNFKVLKILGILYLEIILWELFE
jgi:hypothetical protein